MISSRDFLPESEGFPAEEVDKIEGLLLTRPMKTLIIGGNRFFGLRLAKKLIEENHDVTLLNRGNIDDQLGNGAQRIVCDRSDQKKMAELAGHQEWDVIFDQVCFDYKDAKQACEVFNGRVGKYIYSSTLSVYGAGSNIKEKDFDAKTHTFDEFKTADEHYPKAKQQAEVAFHRYADFPTTLVRFPIVIGEDDYTGRFLFHVNRISEGQPFSVSNLDAKISFISSSFAAKTLYFLAQKDFIGPINAASPSPITIRDFISLIEDAFEKVAILADKSEDIDHSPYGIAQDWYMNCDQLTKLGLKGEEIKDWLPRLLR